MEKFEGLVGALKDITLDESDIVMLASYEVELREELRIAQRDLSQLKARLMLGSDDGFGGKVTDNIRTIRLEADTAEQKANVDNLQDLLDMLLRRIDILMWREKGRG